MSDNLFYGFYDGGPFALNISADGTKVSVNENSRLMSSFIFDSEVPISNINESFELPDANNENFALWIEVDLNNTTGTMTARINEVTGGGAGGGGIWWREYPKPYLIDGNLLNGKFQGQTKIYCPLASIITTKDRSRGITLSNGKLLYRYVANDLMVVQFCDKYVMMPIGICTR